MPFELIRRLTSRGEDRDLTEKTPKSPKPPKKPKTKEPEEKRVIGRVARAQVPGAAPLAETVTIAVRMPQEMFERSAGFDILGDSSTGPIVFKNVSYDEWRKHYAKDIEGNYRGTEAPAEDCLLRPAEMARWRNNRAPAEGSNAESSTAASTDDDFDDAATLQGENR